MGYLVCIGIVFMGFFFKKSKIVTAIMAIYLWSLIALNTYTADFAAYEEMYLCAFEPRYALHEPGYMLLCKIMLSIGFSYRQFRIFIGFLVVFLVIKGLKKCSPYINIALSLLIIFPFEGWVSGLRNTMCLSIVIYICHYLLSEQKGASTKYIFGVIISTLFHYSGMFYLLLLFAKIKRISISLMGGIVMIISAIAFWLFKSGVLYLLASQVTKSQKVLQWLNYQGNFSFLYLATMMIYLCMIFIQYRMLMIVNQRKTYFSNQSEMHLTSEKIKKIIKIAIISMLGFVGGFLRGVVFLRLVIALLPLSYLVFSDVLSVKCNEPYNIKKELIFWEVVIFLMCSFTLLLVFGYWIGGDMIRVYKNNLLFI